jgi:hypothetical protein
MRTQFTGPPNILAIVLPIVVEKPELELPVWVRYVRQNGARLVQSDFERQLRKVRARDARNHARAYVRDLRKQK